jgi:RNA polymerase sigma-70 factor (ECF subfamily)
MTTSEPTDAQLVEAAKSDPAAFEALYRRYLTPVYRYTLARLRSVPDAEDVTATVFVEALTGLEGYTEQGLFPAWLFTIARRQVVAHRRRQARLEPSVPASDTPTPDASLEASDAIVSALDGLSADAREALILRFFADLRVREVAEILGKKESATKMLLHRSLMALREDLA